MAARWQMERRTRLLSTLLGARALLDAELSQGIL
jgi:hypothetical protein